MATLTSARTAAAVIAFAIWIAPARSQAPLFREDFESGAPNWTFQGVWHVEPQSSPCSPPNFPSPTHAAWCGAHTVGCDYSTAPTTVTALASQTPVPLPANAASIALRYRRYLWTERCQPGVDISHVRILDGTGTTTLMVASDCGDEGTFWVDRRIDLTAFAGGTVRMSFEFEPVDGKDNNTPGWFIDDVEIVVEPGTLACTAGPSCPCPVQSLAHGNPFGPYANEDSGGCMHWPGPEARLFANGVASVANDTVELVVHDLPVSTSLVFAQGTTQPSLPFGDGRRCVGGTIVRLATRSVTVGQDTYPHPGELGVALQGSVPALGGTRTYQVVFRDASFWCTASTYNTSNAYVIAWRP